jgi:hypothetical protein
MDGPMHHDDHVAYRYYKRSRGNHSIPKRWGVIGGKLMSAAAERSTYSGITVTITINEPEAGIGSCTRYSLSVSAESVERTSQLGEVQSYSSH